MTVAASLTGGWDSTFMVYRLLANSAEPVLAYYVDFTQCGAPHKATQSAAEVVASARVAQWMNDNVRPFEFRVIPIQSMLAGEWITLEATRIGAGLVEADEADWLAMGRNIEGEKPHRGLKTKAAQLRIYSEVTAKGQIRFPLLEDGLGKPHAHAMLPPGLAALCLNCKSAELVNGEIVECGRCITGCKYNDMIVHKLIEGYTPAQVFDYGQRLMREGPYADLPVSDPSWISRGFSDAVDFPEKYS